MRKLVEPIQGVMIPPTRRRRDETRRGSLPFTESFPLRPRWSVRRGGTENITINSYYATLYHTDRGRVD